MPKRASPSGPGNANRWVVLLGPQIEAQAEERISLVGVFAVLQAMAAEIHLDIPPVETNEELGSSPGGLASASDPAAPAHQALPVQDKSEPESGRAEPSAQTSAQSSSSASTHESASQWLNKPKQLEATRG